jgi:hypothetical protein
MFGILGLQNLWHPLACLDDISVVIPMIVQEVFIEIGQIFNKYLGEVILVHRAN